MWNPTPKYRYSTKLGMRGIEVEALQVNLNHVGGHLAEDGIFGPGTDKAVKAFQGNKGLTIDGIAGVMTQRALILTLAVESTRKHNLPLGLLKSMASNESGFVLAAYSAHPSGEGFDFGPYQLAFPPAVKGQIMYHTACDAFAMAEHVGSDARKLKNKFRQARFVKTDRYAWELGALSHNWPAAAQNLANIGSIFKNPATDKIAQSWIVKASGGRLSTPEEWCAHYIAAATVFVTTWPA